MRKLKKLLKDYFHFPGEFAQITLDLFNDVQEAVDEKRIKKGETEAFEYPTGNLLKVIDQKAFPDDYLFLSRLNEALEELEG